MGGIGVGIALTYVRNYVDFHKFNQVGTIWLISTAVCDLLIACTLTWHLVSEGVLVVILLADGGGLTLLSGGIARGSNIPTTYSTRSFGVSFHCFCWDLRQLK